MYSYASCGLLYLREFRRFAYQVLLCRDDNNVFSVSEPFSNNHTALHISQSAFSSGSIIFVLQILENVNAKIKVSL